MNNLSPKHMSPSAGIEWPALWGTPARIEALFGADAAAIDIAPRQFARRAETGQGSAIVSVTRRVAFMDPFGNRLRFDCDEELV